MVALDDRPADREADSHPFALRGVKWVEQPFVILGIEAHALVAHRQSDFAGGATRGCDFQRASAPDHLPHGVDRVEHEIQNYLLQLYAVAPDHWKIWREVRQQKDPS